MNARSQVFEIAVEARQVEEAVARYFLVRLSMLRIINNFPFLVSSIQSYFIARLASLPTKTTAAISLERLDTKMWTVIT